MSFYIFHGDRVCLVICVDLICSLYSWWEGFGSFSLATLSLGFNCGFISTCACGSSTGVCSWGCPGGPGFALWEPSVEVVQLLGLQGFWHGAWRATVYGVARGGHNWATKHTQYFYHWAQGLWAFLSCGTVLEFILHIYYFWVVKKFQLMNKWARSACMCVCGD